MPFKIIKKGKCYSVKSPKNTLSKCTTKEMAKAQIRLVQAKEKKK